MELFGELFRPAGGDETNLLGAKPFSAFGADIRKQPMAIHLPTKTADSAGRPEPETRQMRTVSFILAFVLAGPSMAGSPDSVPGIGTFAYKGSPIASAPHSIVVAARQGAGEPAMEISR